MNTKQPQYILYTFDKKHFKLETVKAITDNPNYVVIYLRDDKDHIYMKF